ncbi:hypothetical protein HDU93_002303 [Gonapodya sp. JEL0774]|nr:hypothetical protein HDU93_002303 [Gonapodya sp. JEL0774]
MSRCRCVEALNQISVASANKALEHCLADSNGKKTIPFQRIFQDFKAAMAAGDTTEKGFKGMFDRFESIESLTALLNGEKTICRLDSNFQNITGPIAELLELALKSTGLFVKYYNEETFKESAVQNDDCLMKYTGKDGSIALPLSLWSLLNTLIRIEASADSGICGISEFSPRMTTEGQTILRRGQEDRQQTLWSDSKCSDRATTILLCALICRGMRIICSIIVVANPPRPRDWSNITEEDKLYRTLARIEEIISKMETLELLEAVDLVQKKLKTLKID